MADKNKDRELTNQELKGITGGKTAPQPSKGKAGRTPFGIDEPIPDTVIDPDPKPARPKFGTDKGGKR